MRRQFASRAVAAAVVGLVVALLGGAPPAGAVFPANVGGELVFTSDRDGDAEIYSMAPDGLPQTRRTAARSQEVAPALSPGGLNAFAEGGIAYASDREGSWDVYALHAPGDERRLTAHPRNDFAPAWSPRADRIAFTSDRDGNREIYTVSSTVPESGLVNLTSNPANDGGAAWSSWLGAPRPDGGVRCTRAAPAIAFHSNRSGSFDLWLVAETGGAPTQVTSGPDADFNPNWSPRCDFLAFERRRGTNYDIWVVSLADGQATQLTFGAAADTDPVWSPNGVAIAFTTDRDGNDEVYVLELVLVPAIGPGEVHNRSQSPGASDYAPEWNGVDFIFSDPTLIPPPAGGGAGALTCTRTGTSKGERLEGTGGRDVLCGRGGDDVLVGKGGRDVLVGGLGRDRLRGGGGEDELRARDGFADRELDGGGDRDRARFDEGRDPRPAGVENPL